MNMLEQISAASTTLLPILENMFTLFHTVRVGRLVTVSLCE